MATLNETDRQRIWRGLMRHWSNLRQLIDGPKAELLTTVNETDNWINAAQSNYLGSLTYGDNYTAEQKVLLFCCVACARTGQIELLRRLLGVGVD